MVTKVRVSPVVLDQCYRSIRRRMNQFYEICLKLHSFFEALDADVFICRIATSDGRDAIALTLFGDACWKEKPKMSTKIWGPL